VVDEAFREPLLRWIPLLPLAVALLHGISLGVLRRPWARGAVIAVSCGAPLLSLLAAGISFAHLVALPDEGNLLLDVVYTWIGAGLGDASFSADFAFQLDALSAVMTLLVTSVGLAVHVYAIDYMDHDERDDRGFQRFFCHLNLTMGAMLLLVLADNLLLMLAGWQLVGLGAYLLIGFWYRDATHAYAGSKAFIVHRVGDFGLLVAVLMLFWALSDVGAPTMAFRGMEAAFGELATRTFAAPDGSAEILLVDVIGLCLVLAACAKSAQLPLHIWLPDETASPTPASALIQTATSAAAGVYLLCRLSFLFAAAPLASTTLAWVGCCTALFAAVAAAGQRDLKGVLAYSTMSQLGLAFLAVGCGAYTAAIFHVVAHAFVKCALFFGAGTVIQSLQGERDMRRMGALRKRLPKTRFLVLTGGVLVLAGLPGSAGFFSYDEILLAAYRSSLPGREALDWMATATAVFTAFYILRCYFLVFEGDSHVEREVRAHMHEPSNLVLGPLYAMVLLAVFASLLGFPEFWGDRIGIEDSNSLANFLAPVLSNAPAGKLSERTEWAVIASGASGFMVGGLAAWWLYLRNPKLRARVSGSVATLLGLVRSGYGADEIYDRALVRPLLGVSDRVLHRGAEQGLIDGLAVNGLARAIWLLAQNSLRHFQSGMTQGYLVVTIGGVLCILLYLVR